MSTGAGDPATLTASESAMIVKNGEQIEGDSIRCPYHGWRYDPNGDVDDIPYFDGPCPKSASIRSYPVVDNMGCIMAWYDPDGREPEHPPDPVAIAAGEHITDAMRPVSPSRR